MANDSFESKGRAGSANDEAEDPAALREAALRLLARREHSRRELVDKLVRKGWSNSGTERLLDELADEGLQSESRFAESYIRQRAGRGYGPVRIRAELRQRGVDDSDAGRAFETLEIDFFERAASFYDRKYGHLPPPADIQERAKRHQAMQRRGFTTDQLREIDALSR
jgi:regulatory protein